MPAARTCTLPHIARIVDTANALHSDLIVLLGDFKAYYKFRLKPIDGSAMGAPSSARLRAPLGVWAILGNHDWWHDLAWRAQALADVRIPVLENDAVLLGARRAEILAGRHWRSARALDRARTVSRRRRSAGHARANHDRRSGRAAGPRAGHFPARAGARCADARRSHPWRTDPRAVHLAAIRAVATTARALPTVTSSKTTGT